MIVNRPWHQAWEYDAGEIAAAEKSLDALYEAAGRTHESPEAAEAVAAALLDDLDVPRALAVATEEGGSAARRLVETLKLR
jgi:cysteinyl-tRNA synthetase